MYEKISKEAIKAKKKYKRVGFVISAIALNPLKMSKIKVLIQRFYLYFVIGLFSKKAKESKFEKVNMNGIRSWKITTPNSDPNKILLYFHGGAYIAGSSRAYYPMISHIADVSKFTVYMPDYRLAPEYLYPTQLEDGVNAYKSLIEEFGYSHKQIAIGGDSAGGNLAFVTIFKLREEGIDLPKAIFSFSPWADPAATGDTYTIEICEKDLLLGPVFKKTWTKYKADAYLTYYVPDEVMSENDPYICPIKGSFKHFPPTLIHVGRDELLLSDSRSLKFGLDRDNVELEYKEWDNLWHVFQVESLIPESQESFKLVSKFLNTNI